MLKQKGFYVFLLLALITLAIMAPIASDVYYADNNNFSYHFVNILQARTAILEGAWLHLRVSPLMFYGWFYPVFQFYSPTPFTVAGYLYILFPHNLMDVYKITIGLALVLGAWYSYKLFVFLFRNEVAALLGALLYLFSPYLITDISVQADLPETFAQGILPIALYYAFRMFFESRFDRKVYFMWAGVFAFYLLATSHFITFIYASLFAALLFIALAVLQGNLRGFFSLALVYLFALVLAAWHLGPVILYGHELHMGVHEIVSPYWSNWLTLFPTLISPKGIAPFPKEITSPIFLYPGIGLPVVIGVCYWVYVFGYKRPQALAEHIDLTLIKVVLCIFFIAFFMVWTPCNFWKYLPYDTYVVQTTYRLLIDTAWLGGLLFVPALILIFKNQLHEAHLATGGFLLAVSAALWMHTSYYTPTTPGASESPVNKTEGAWILQEEGRPDAADYLMGEPSSKEAGGPLQSHHEEALLVSQVQKSCIQKNLASLCTLQIHAADEFVQLPILYYPNLLKITVDHQEVPYFSSVSADQFRSYQLAEVRLSRGPHIVKSQFVGLSWANRLSAIAWGLYLLGILVLILKHRLQNTKK